MNNDLILAERRIFYELYSGNSSERPDELENRYFSLKDLLDKDGFLEEVPQNSKVKTISDIAELPGAIIVAEAGMGKTHVMEYLASSVDAGLKQLFYASEYLSDATSFGNEIRDVDKNIKTILIDGLDENPDAIQAILRTLKKHQQNKKVFLATRALKTLRSISERLSLPVYFLLPLSKRLVYDYASHEGVDSKEFIKTIIHNGLQPVCSNPLGCNLLVQQYKKNKLLNVSNDSLWKDSICALCAENDSKTKFRNETKDDVTQDECMEEAAKIALILKLSNQSTIEIEQDFSTKKQERNVRLYHCFWRDIPKLKEILSRAIFVPVGDNCFEFAHKTFQDYLAAWGLFHFVQRENWEAILLSRECHDIYPQWEDVATVLASFDDKWCDKVLKKRPDILLSSDEAVSKLDHAKLLERIFQKSMITTIGKSTMVV